MGLTKWTATTNPVEIRRFGKLLEECGELVAVAARCIIQGIDEVDPSSNRLNLFRLEDELADVAAQIGSTVHLLELNEGKIMARIEKKAAQMEEWEAMYDNEVVAVH